MEKIREDVVKSRDCFVKHIDENKENYYKCSIDENNNISWVRPIRKEDGSLPIILVAHDETTFRSYDMSNKRWFFADNAPFFNKGYFKNTFLILGILRNICSIKYYIGKGLGYMLSDFIVFFLEKLILHSMKMSRKRLSKNTLIWQNILFFIKLLLQLVLNRVQATTLTTI